MQTKTNRRTAGCRRTMPVLLAALLLATGCVQEPFLDGKSEPSGEEVLVTLNLTPKPFVSPLEADAAAVRSAIFPEAMTANEEGAMSLRLLPQEPETRASAAELQIRNIWVLQFEGTDQTSTLVRKEYLPNYNADSRIALQPRSLPQWIVVFANSYDPALCDKMAIGRFTFEETVAMIGPKTGAINANGFVPLSGTTRATIQEGASVTLSMNNLVAKVVLQVKVNDDMPTGNWNLKLKNLAPTHWQPDIGDTPWPASNELTGESFDAKTGVTLSATGYTQFIFYLPVNRRGTVAGTTNLTRKTKAPAGATYIELSNATEQETVLTTRRYYLHMGANFTTDYNLRQNTQYTYQMTLRPAAGSDSRVEVTVTPI